jgi:hypothetical protein
MKTTYSILSRVSGIYHLNKLRDENKLIVYSDTITFSKMENFMRTAEKKLQKHENDGALRKRIFGVMVECLQNINLQKQADADLRLSLLAVGFKSSKSFFVLAGNTVNKKEGKFLRNKIDEINELNNEQVKLRFKELLSSVELAKFDESGLYLFDIARKARSKLRYRFIPVDREHLFFVLKVTINKEITPTVSELPINFYNIALTYEP